MSARITWVASLVGFCVIAITLASHRYHVRQLRIAQTKPLKTTTSSYIG